MREPLIVAATIILFGFFALMGYLASTTDDAVCYDSVTVIEASPIRDGSHRCEHPKHTMTTEHIGLTKSAVKVTCACPR